MLECVNDCKEMPNPFISTPGEIHWPSTVSFNLDDGLFKMELLKNRTFTGSISAAITACWVPLPWGSTRWGTWLESSVWLKTNLINENIDAYSYSVYPILPLSLVNISWYQIMYLWQLSCTLCEVQHSTLFYLYFIYRI